MATSVSGKMSRRSGRVWRSAKRKIAPSIAAMTACAEVRNIGEKSATATLVAGRDPLKIITPRRPLPDPALVRSICPAFLTWELKGQGWRETMGVSPSTVVEAYDRLEAEGSIRARRGSGFYVTGANLPPMALAEMGPTRERDVDPFWVSRQSLDADASVAKRGCGWLPAEWMPNAALRRGLRAHGRANDAVLSDYGSTRGSLALRRLLLGRFADEGITATADQLILTGSGTQAIDLICRLLLRPGDAVLVDDPCYFNFQALLRAHQVRIVGVPFTPTGPDTSAFEQALVDEDPRVYITNSALHNPTGASISPQTAHRVLSTAAAHGLTIVEDDIFADFEPSLSPRLAILDGLNRVIRMAASPRRFLPPRAVVTSP